MGQQQSSSSSSSSYFPLSPFGYFQSLEQTISSVSESIGVFNNVLEDLSRNILEDTPSSTTRSSSSNIITSSGSGNSSTSGSSLYTAFITATTGSSTDDNDLIPDSQLKDVPIELDNPSSNAVTTYLQRCGVEAESFQKILHDTSLNKNNNNNNNGLYSSSTLLVQSNTTTPTSSSSSVLKPINTVDVSDIPLIFFDEQFDLTNPTTFCELLLQDKGIGIYNILNNNNNNNNSSSSSNSSTTPNRGGGGGSSTGSVLFDTTRMDDIAISDLIPVLHPDSLNGYFDMVELALLEQVQGNSNQFLIESQRFAEIHQDIHTLLDIVQDQKSIVSILQKDMIHTGNVIPQCDTIRGQLRTLSSVLDIIDTVLQCKNGLATIVSSHDDLNAINQIQYGRKLLSSQQQQQQQQPTTTTTGTKNNIDNDNDNDGTTTTTSVTDEIHTRSQDKTIIELGNVRALQSVTDQLQQYEELVVTNLRDELIDIFLSWNDHITTTSTTTLTSTSSTVATTPIFISGMMPTTTSSSSKIVHDTVRNRVKEIIIALQSCNAIIQTKDSYQNRVHDMIRMTVRTTVTEFASDNTTNNHSGNASTSSSSSNGTSTVPVVATTTTASTLSSAATAMSLPRFLDCLDMLFEQIITILTSLVSVDAFLITEGILFNTNKTSTTNNTNGNEAVEVDVPLTTTTPTTTTTSDTAANNDEGTRVEGFEPIPPQNETPLLAVLISAAVLSSKSISELLRIRKEAHSLISLEEIKTIWDVCTDFSRQVENLCSKGVAVLDSSTSTQTQTPTAFVHTSLLRSTLLAQAKAFVERKHESHMSSLVAALDSERWVQCEVTVERQSTLDRLCSGRAILIPSANATTSHVSSFLTSNGTEVSTSMQDKLPEIEAEGVRYKVVWSCLLLIEMILTNIAISGQFASLSTSSVSKVSELLRLFNSRTTHLVLGAGAIHSNARLKSINAKHLSLVTQCLGLIMAIVPHIRAALAAHMPKKQHTLLLTLDQIKKEYGDHNEKILNKFVSIIGGIVEHGLAKQLFGTDFDQRALVAKTTAETPPTVTLSCCVFLDGAASNTRKMHQVLCSLLPPDHLKDVFSRIFAYIDGKLPALFITAAESTERQQQAVKVARKEGKNIPTGHAPFCFPKTIEGKRQLLLEIENATQQLNNLDGVHPWDFTARNVLERRIEYSLFLKQDVYDLNNSTGEATVEATDEATNVDTNETTEGEDVDRKSKIQSDVGDSDREEMNDTGSQLEEPSIASVLISRTNTPDYDDDDTTKPKSDISVNSETPSPTDDDDEEASKTESVTDVVNQSLTTTQQDTESDNATPCDSTTVDGEKKIDDETAAANGESSE